jgi:type I restriction enzyme S subunit
MSFKYTEIGKIPVEWDVKMIQEIGEVVSGGTPKTKEDSYWDGNISWITPRDLSSFTERYIEVGERSITELGLKNSSAKLLPKGTVLFSSRAPIGYLAIARKELCTNQGFKNIVCDKKYSSNEFLFYMLKAKMNEIESIAGGSTFKEVSGKVVKEFKIPMPPLNEQKAIAHILSTLDDKIEVNNQINKTLENMAQAIFKQWFVDFEFPNEDGEPYKSSGGEMVESELGMIPKGWEVVELNKLAKLTMGLSPKSESYNTDYIGTPLLNGAADFNNGLIKANKFTTQPTRICEKGDLVFCIRATIGNITFADQEFCLGRGVAALKPLSGSYIGLIYFNLDMAMERLKANATGSVILGLSKPDINNLKIILPSEDILNRFSEISNNILNFKHNFEREIGELIDIRDALLPKLMSGEIRVPLDEEGGAS